uniref:Proteasome inhibitor PI31 subunit n=1 Tax=Eptatretus burgeri TaxID=7764 RepID=A0A8C4PVS1_EPTBU
MPGLELLLAAARPVSPADALVCFLHWSLIQDGLHCVGLGEQTDSAMDVKSEKLPRDWNSNNDVYILRYKSPDERKALLMKMLVVDGNAIINVLNMKTEQVVDATIKLEDHISEGDFEDPEKTFKNETELRSLVQKKLMVPLNKDGTQRDGGKSKGRSFGNERDVDRRVPLQHPRGFRQPDLPVLPPFEVGGADLDPFGHGRGGMFVDPFHAGRPYRGPGPNTGLPPGALPPGARFDPIRPFGPFSGPNPDHLRPPDDDMFM